MGVVRTLTNQRSISLSERASDESLNRRHIVDFVLFSCIARAC